MNQIKEEISKLLDTQLFRLWLEDKNKLEIVGVSAESKACPIFCYIKDQLGDVPDDLSVDGKSISWNTSYSKYDISVDDYSMMPTKLACFIGKIDWSSNMILNNGNNVTAEMALEILDRC